MKTSFPKPPEATWYIVDVAGKTLGRVAAKVAHVLRGKNRASFSPPYASRDHVIIVNVEQLALTPAKKRRKTYFHHTGTLGHSRIQSLGQMMRHSPVSVMEGAIKGMLPRNRQRLRLLKQLHVFSGSDHPYKAQKPVSLDPSTL